MMRAYAANVFSCLFISKLAWLISIISSSFQVCSCENIELRCGPLIWNDKIRCKTVKQLIVLIREDRIIFVIVLAD